MRLVLSAILLVALFHAADLRGAEVIGIEAPGMLPPPAPAVAETASETDSVGVTEASISAPDLSSIYASGGVGAQAGAVSGHITIGYAFNRYAALDTTLHYLRHDEADTWGERYGPDLALVLRYPNTTIVTPFVGAGPGFIKWKRYRDDEPYASDHVYTGNLFGGLSLRLMRHFALVALRKQSVYWTDPPTRVDDSERREARSEVTNQFGFQVMF